MEMSKLFAKVNDSCIPASYKLANNESNSTTRCFVGVKFEAPGGKCRALTYRQDTRPVAFILSQLPAKSAISRLIGLGALFIRVVGDAHVGPTTVEK